MSRLEREAASIVKAMNLDFQQGASDRLTLPKRAGIYAEVCWPERGVRIGETGVSIQDKIEHDWRWFRKMHDGTASQEDLRRADKDDPHPIVIAAIKYGPYAFEAFLVSADPRLADKNLRQQCERRLFEVIRESDDWADWNRQRSWR